MSRLDSIRIAQQAYADACKSYADGMHDVEHGDLPLGAIASIDEDRATAALDYADDAFDFLADILPALEVLRVAVGGLTEPGPSFAGTATLAAAQDVVAILSSHRGTDEGSPTVADTLRSSEHSTS